MNDLYGVIEITFKNTNVIKKGKIYVDIFLMLSITWLNKKINLEITLFYREEGKLLPVAREMWFLLFRQKNYTGHHDFSNLK